MTKVKPLCPHVLKGIGEHTRIEARKRGIVMAAYARPNGGFTMWGEPTTLNGLRNLIYVANQEKN